MVLVCLFETHSKPLSYDNMFSHSIFLLFECLQLLSLVVMYSQYANKAVWISQLDHLQDFRLGGEGEESLAYLY